MRYDPIGFRGFLRVICSLSSMLILENDVDQRRDINSTRRSLRAFFALSSN